MFIWIVQWNRIGTLFSRMELISCSWTFYSRPSNNNWMQLTWEGSPEIRQLNYLYSLKFSWSLNQTNKFVNSFDFISNLPVQFIKDLDAELLFSNSDATTWLFLIRIVWIVFRAVPGAAVAALQSQDPSRRLERAPPISEAVCAHSPRCQVVARAAYLAGVVTIAHAFLTGRTYCQPHHLSIIIGCG